MSCGLVVGQTCRTSCTTWTVTEHGLRPQYVDNDTRQMGSLACLSRWLHSGRRMVRRCGMALVESQVDPQGEDHRNSSGSGWDRSDLAGANFLAHDQDERLHELRRTWSA